MPDGVASEPEDDLQLMADNAAMVMRACCELSRLPVAASPFRAMEDLSMRSRGDKHSPARQALLDVVSDYLAEFERNGDLYFQGAEKVVDRLLSHELIHQALLDHVQSGGKSLGSGGSQP